MKIPCFVLLLVLLTAVAWAEPHATIQRHNISTQAVVDTGAIVYYGYELTRPYQFGSDRERMFVRCPTDTTLRAAGLEWIPWPNQKNNAMQTVDQLPPCGPLESLARNVQMKVESTAVFGEQYDGQERAERRALFYRQSALIDTAYTLHSSEGWQVAVIPHDGLPFKDLEGAPSRNPVSEGQRVAERIQRLIFHLQHGRMVFVDTGVEVSVPFKFIPQVRKEISDLRKGRKLPATAILTTTEIVKRFQEPKKPIRSFVEGRE